MPMTEIELIQSMKQGDESAFTALYKIYWAKVHNFSRLYLSSLSEVEEVVQEVFVKVWESRALIREKESFSGFLFIITRNTIFNQFRRSFNDEAYRDTVLSAAQVSTTYGVEDDLYAAELKDCLMRLLSELPPRQQEVFRMSRMEHMSYKEIALRLSISEKTVERHVNEALKFLKKNMQLFSIFISL